MTLREWAGERHKPISAASLCACSALPFVEQTVKVGGHVYCEGALVDTVNFRRLLEDHHSTRDPLDEIWINRIVDVHQIRQAQNLHDALANLCQLFAATVGEDDIKLFKLHVKENNRLPEKERKGPALDRHDHRNRGRPIRSIFIGRIQISRPDARMAPKARTTRSNCTRSTRTRRKRRLTRTRLLMIPDDLTDQEILDADVPLSPRRKREREEKLLGSHESTFSRIASLQLRQDAFASLRSRVSKPSLKRP